LTTFDVKLLDGSAQIDALPPYLVNFHTRGVPRLLDIGQTMYIPLRIGRRAAQRTILVAAEREQKAGLLDPFEPFDIGAIHFLKLLEASQVDFNFGAALLVP
jgi:hypothetical protein